MSRVPHSYEHISVLNFVLLVGGTPYGIVSELDSGVHLELFSTTSTISTRPTSQKDIAAVPNNLEGTIRCNCQF